MPGHPAPGQRRPGGGEHQDDDQERAQDQQENVLELEPALVLAGGGHEVADGGKGHRRRLAAGEEVQQHGDRRGHEAGERPRMEKADHAERDDGASASRSTTPNGVSVVTRW